MAPKNNKKRRARKRHYRKQLSENVEPEINVLMRNFEDDLHLESELETLIVDESYLTDEFFILGEGSFGLVTLGTFKKPQGSVIRVALKGANRFAFIDMMKGEAKVMARFDHVNVVRLLGVQKKPFKIVMEYMQHGDLLDALENGVFPHKTDLMEISIQVSSGMEYISEMNYVHRDLACRNVFVNQKKQCKIGDFGLCRYVGDSGGVFEGKAHIFGPKQEVQYFNSYCAPEAICSNKFTTKCDVWSMGLLMWELYISAANGVPSFYKRMCLDFFVLTSSLAQPKMCSDNLFSYIKNVLLKRDPSKRPIFSEVKEHLCKFRNNEQSYVV